MLLNSPTSAPFLTEFCVDERSKQARRSRSVFAAVKLQSVREVGNVFPHRGGRPTGSLRTADTQEVWAKNMERQLSRKPDEWELLIIAMTKGESSSS